MLYRKEDIAQSLKTVPEIPTTVSETSMFSYGLELMEESDMEIRMTLLSIYDEQCLNEAKLGFPKFDLMNIIKKIVRFFIETIAKLFNRFRDIIMQLLYMDSTVKRYKGQLKNMTRSIDLSKNSEIVWYNYTYLEASIPNPDLYLKFSENYEVSLTELRKIANTADKTRLISDIDNLTNGTDTMPDGEFFNKLRGDIIHSGNGNKDLIVTSEIYPEQLRMLFRDGATEGFQGKMTITPQQIAKSCDRFLNGKDLVKSIEKQKSTIESAASTMQKKFEKLTAKSIWGMETDLEVEAAMARYGKKKAGQLADMCNIFLLAFSAKLDAIKEALIMDKQICFTAITYILQGEG